MAVLFSLSWFVLALSAVGGYGAVLLGALLGPSLTRLDPPEAAAVAQVTYRIGARGAENACYLVGPAAVGVLVDAVSPLWDDRSRALHDRFAGSVVVRNR